MRRPSLVWTATTGVATLFVASVGVWSWLVRADLWLCVVAVLVTVVLAWATGELYADWRHDMRRYRAWLAGDAPFQHGVLPPDDRRWRQ
jgi:membrane protein YdbS with pleckstrin-like domain